MAVASTARNGPLAFAGEDHEATLVGMADIQDPNSVTIDSIQNAGVHLERSTNTSSINIGGVEVASSMSEVFRFVLPQAAGFDGGFGSEGVIQKLAKVFSKEIQVDDPAFDDKVYVRGNSDELKRFLQNEVVRSLIVDVVAPGGSVAVEGTTVKVAVPLKAAMSDNDVARLVAHILTFT